MKRRWAELRRGQVVLAEVIEQQANGGLLVSWQGELLLVHNQSSRPLKPGERIALEVITVAPLSFALCDGPRKPSQRLQIVT